MEQAAPKEDKIVYQELSQNKLPEINTELQVMVDEVLRSLPEVQLKNVNVTAVISATYNPNLFILNEQHKNILKLLNEEEKGNFKTVMKANKHFVSLLNQKQKEMLVHYIHEYNQALFKEVKSQLEFLHKENQEMHQKMRNAKSAQELFALVETKEAQEAFKHIVARFEQEQQIVKEKQKAEDALTPSKMLDIDKNFLARVIYFTQVEEAFAAITKQL